MSQEYHFSTGRGIGRPGGRSTGCTETRCRRRGSLECAGGSHEDVLLKQLTTTTLVRLGRGKTVARRPVKQLKRKAGRQRRRNEWGSETHLSHPPSAQPFQSLRFYKIELHPDLNLM